MRRKFLYPLPFALCLLCLLPGPFCSGVDAAVDPVVEALVRQISGDSLDATVRRMVAFETRFMGSDSNAAATHWMAGRLKSAGYRQVRFDTFAVNVNRQVLTRRFVIQGLEQWNVVATKPGVLFPDRQVVLGAHYDSISIDRDPDAQDVAPGADDNGSGVAALLEIARVLQGIELDVTVVFALFGAEELGLIGSRAYVRQARARGDEIALMLQLDAIGSRSTLFPEAFTIDTIGPYLSQGEAVAQAAADYTEMRARTSGGGRVLITSRGCRCSDHQSFIDGGYPGIGVFQYIQNPEDHLNRSIDTLDRVDLSMVEEVTKAALAAVAQAAGFPSRSPDFDGDGEVGLGDFLLFAPAFGKEAAEAARFDLDRNGRVGFSDFLLFAERFGEGKA